MVNRCFSMVTEQLSALQLSEVVVWPCLRAFLLCVSTRVCVCARATLVFGEAGPNICTGTNSNYVTLVEPNKY